MISSRTSETLPPTRLIAISNQKGGVGKTTSAVNLGAALARGGKNVLLVDLDPQGNATTGLGIDRKALQMSTYEVLIGQQPPDNAILPTPVQRLSIIPATVQLAGSEIELVDTPAREMRLRDALQELDSTFDFILVDCPPSLGLLTINALCAARELVVPIQCEFYALEGVGQLMNNVALVQRSLNPLLRVSGIILTMYDVRTKLSEEVAREVRSHFGRLVFEEVVPRSVRLSEAPSYGLPISLYDPHSRAAQAYTRLARMLEERVGAQLV